MQLKSVINLFGGPGSGKSTTACGLFAIMKKNGYNVEYVDEYAKEKTYEKEHLKLEDQLYILAMQHRKMYRLIKDVEYIVTDSPLILSSIYFVKGCIYDDYMFKNFVYNLYNKYNNINFFITRDSESYSEIGRNQNLAEAMIIDKKILNYLDIFELPYEDVSLSPNTDIDIFNKLKQSNYI